MSIRGLEPTDIDALLKIHKKHYEDEFEFPDFFNRYLCAFIVTNDHGKIISGGGVRVIAESVILTDKDCSARERYSALKEVLVASEYMTREHKFYKLHAVTEDDKWKRQLTKAGFHSRGNILVLDI